MKTQCFANGANNLHYPASQRAYKFQEMKTQNIFALPVDQVCGALDKLVLDSHPHDLLQCLEHIVDILYGPNSRWDLRSISLKSDGITYNFLLQFLIPDGPIFRLIYKLVAYWDSKTVYNLTECMVWIRDLFDEGMPEYFMDKVSIDDRTRKIMHMSLNAFEFYMLHFAYYIINPWTHRSHETSKIHDSVYMRLLESYLIGFMPCGSLEVLPYVPVSYSSLRSTLPRNNQASYSSDPKPCIFRSSMFRNTTDTVQQPYKHNVLVWRSEAVIYIFIYVWLNYGKQDTATGNIVREPPPSVDHVRVVRTMIKHFHFFANSALGDMSAMDSLKRIVRPLCTDKIYRFLRRAIYNWPLDISFRVILEAWLSYIQPWRYTDYSQYGILANRSQPDLTRERQVERVWQYFILENLFTYTIVYQQVLPRFYQLDLTTYMNSMMIQRVLKVFAQQNLNVMIAEVESCLVDYGKWEKNLLPDQHNVLPPVLNMDGTSLATVVENSSVPLTMGRYWQAILCQKLLNLEGLHYKYTPMFQRDTNEAYKLLDLVMAAYISSHVFMTTAEHEASFSQDSWLTTLKKWIMGDFHDLYCTSLTDRVKVVGYLKQTLSYIAHIYNVPVPVLPDPRGFQPMPISPIKFRQTPTVTKVSPERWQVSVSPSTARRSPPSYQGDPDLMPIMSHECGFCVKMLYKLTRSFNNEYSANIRQLFNQPGFVGGVARQILSHPKTIRYYDKHDSVLGHARLVETTLPSRLSLRWLATYKVLVGFILLLISSYIIFDSWLYLVLIGLGLWFVCIVIRAVLEPWWPIVAPERTEPPSEMREHFDLDISMQSNE